MSNSRLHPAVDQPLIARAGCALFSSTRPLIRESCGLGGGGGGLVGAGRWGGRGKVGKWSGVDE